TRSYGDWSSDVCSSDLYYDADGGYTDVGKHEGIMLPAGAYYWFEAISEEPLVLLRIGCRAGGQDPRARLNIRGEPMPGDSKENRSEERRVGKERGSGSG